MEKQYIVIAVACLLIGSEASAANFCDTVITNRAFNTTSIETRASSSNSIRQRMCHEEWSNYQEFRNSATSQNIDGEYASYAFNLAESDAKNSGKVQQSRQHYCGLSDSEYTSDYAQRSSSTTTDMALAAWSTCVNSYLATQQQGLFIAVSDGPDYDYFDLRFLLKTESGARLKLLALNKDTPSLKVTCLDGETPVAPTEEKPYEFTTYSKTIRCTKEKPISVMMSLNTSEGTIDNIHSYGQNASTYDRDQMTAQIKGLQTQIVELKNNLAYSTQVARDITAQMEQKFNAAIKETEERVTVHMSRSDWPKFIYDEAKPHDQQLTDFRGGSLVNVRNETIGASLDVNPIATYNSGCPVGTYVTDIGIDVNRTTINNIWFYCRNVNINPDAK